MSRPRPSYSGGFAASTLASSDSSTLSPSGTRSFLMPSSLQTPSEEINTNLSMQCAWRCSSIWDPWCSQEKLQIKSSKFTKNILSLRATISNNWSTWLGQYARSCGLWATTKTTVRTGTKTQENQGWLAWWTRENKQNTWKNSLKSQSTMTLSVRQTSIPKSIKKFKKYTAYPKSSARSFRLKKLKRVLLLKITITSKNPMKSQPNPSRSKSLP